MDVTLEVDGQPHDLTLAKRKGGYDVAVGDQAVKADLERNGTGVLVRIAGRTFHVELARPGEARVDGKTVAYKIHAVTGTAAAAAAGAKHTTHVRPPMNGKLESMRVKSGQSVAKGDVLFVLEAMKMHNEVKAPVAGVVKAIHLTAGMTVEPKQVVLDLEPA